MKKNRVFVAIYISLFGMIAAAYLIGVLYYSERFLPNTTIEGFDCSNKTVADVSDMVRKEALNYTVEVYGRVDGEGTRGLIISMTGKDMGIKLPDLESNVYASLKTQNPFLWIGVLADRYYEPELDKAIVFDEEKISELITGSKYFKKENMVQPVSASVGEFNEESGEYEIDPGIVGNVLFVKGAVKQITEACEGLAQVVELGEESYKEQGIRADNKKLNEGVNKANKMLAACITYDWNGTEVKVDINVIKDWITFSGFEPEIDESALSKFVDEMAYANDTYGKRRNFMTSLGFELELPSGAYGWKTDRSIEKPALLELITKGAVVEKEPEYVTKGYVKGRNDIGDSYVEINLTDQHLYLYMDGEVILESDFVSGNVSNGNTTPPGVFGITYKQQDAVLRGANYETHVKYWMPFNGNIGMHDATWRRNFGGDIYLTNGSHGCVNLPLKKAKEIYSYMESGFPVVCYYYEQEPVEEVEVVY
ncbi:MAG: L,D-transpeptidase/peptidoglycan binding protein [Acetatifactor sp.]|nr:L,D-transpeptidase/peptidoglycan binding protein [Acetatifactor sp.]